MPNIKINLSEKYLYNKKNILKWRENHREEYNDIQKLYKLRYYNKQKIWRAISKVYMNILLE
jgi:hypothetical protein